MVDYLQTLFHQDMTVSVVYIYYRYDRPNEQQPSELFLSLCRQLTEKQPSLLDEVESRYDQREQKGRPLDDKTSKHLLRSVAQQYAKRSRNTKVVRMLLETGASVEADDIENRTPLSYAVQEECEAVVNLLFDLGGAKADTRAHDGTSALSYAAGAGNTVQVKLLLDCGTDPETFSIFDGNAMGLPLLSAV